MHSLTLFTLLAASSASILPPHPLFPRTISSRSPCPALNVLANEGILPNSGLNITAPMFITALTSIYNLDRSFAETLATGAISSVGKSKDATAIDLADLNKHDIIEHDASLTRNDFRQGDNFHVQPALLDALIADAGKSGYVTVESLAKTRARRESDSKAGGSPALSAKANTLAYGESGLLLQALGHLPGSGTKPTGWAAPIEAVRQWVGEERLPKGWTPPPKQISTVSTGVVAGEVTAARTAAGALGALNGLLGAGKGGPASGARYH